MAAHMVTVQPHPTSLGTLDAEICKLDKILVKASEHAGPVQVVKPLQGKPEIIDPEIKQAAQSKRKAFWE